MESIRILQDIFERLYALSVPMRDFLEDELSALSRNWWRNCVEPTLGRENTFMYVDTSRITLDDVDIYYLTKIILKNWPRLRENSCGKYEFTQKHQDNFRRLQEVRNRIAHPEHRHYTAEEYKEYLEVINTAASFFGKEIAALIQGLHQQEKAKILGIIQQKVLEPAIACKTLDQDIKKSVVDTLSRLQKKTTAREIVDFFTDALDAKRGKVVYAALKANGLKSFEDIKSLILACYYGFE